MLEILSNSFFSIVKPAKEKSRMPRKNKGTYLSFSISYLILKKINPSTGKKKKRPKIKLSLVYKFFFFKKKISQPIANTGFDPIYFFRKFKFAIGPGDWLLFYAKTNNFN
jgi:hypothetical protein